MISIAKSSETEREVLFGNAAERAGISNPSIVEKDFWVCFTLDYHCKPCPVGIDIGLVNKYYDLAKAGDGMAKDHYQKLEKNAADCIRCGHCDRRCPFDVLQSERMREIAKYMRG